MLWDYWAATDLVTYMIIPKNLFALSLFLNHVSYLEQKDKH
jgi:hypothetical protein